MECGGLSVLHGLAVLMGGVSFGWITGVVLGYCLRLKLSDKPKVTT